MSIKTEILDFHRSATDYLAPKRVLWDEYDNLISGILADRVSNTTKSNIKDPQLWTMQIESSNRTMAQLPVGKVRGISKNDGGTDKLMNLILDKYILPNANAQFDFLIKSRLVNLYSKVYGNFFTFIDWDVKKNGYIGPDMWMLNIRDVFPQVGAMSVEDSDKILVRTWRSLDFFERLKKQDGFKNVNKIITDLSTKGGDKDSRDSDSMTPREGSQFSSATAAKKAGYFQVFSYYERDRWVDFVPSVNEQDGNTLRDIKNPHENGELPVVCKYSQPLIDDFMGQGRFELGKSMQYAKNSLWNLYFDSIKMSIFPPVLINKTNIASMSTVKMGPATKWIGRNDVNNMAKFLEVSPAGTNTFNNAYQILSANLMGQNGTTQTNTTASTDPGFGKTPQALQMQQARESTGDNADRFYQEQFLKQVIDRMVNLIAKKQSGEIRIRLFEDEIKELKMAHPEMEESYDEKTGKLAIPKGKFKSMKFDYEIVTGSTYKADEAKQQENLQSLLTLVLQGLQINPQTGEVTSPLIAKLKEENKQIKIGELVTRITANSGIQDWDKIIVDLNNNGGDQLEQMLQGQMGQFSQGLTGLPDPMGQLQQQQADPMQQMQQAMQGQQPPMEGMPQ
jgi:hypothetical protein